MANAFLPLPKNARRWNPIYGAQLAGEDLPLAEDETVPADPAAYTAPQVQFPMPLIAKNMVAGMGAADGGKTLGGVVGSKIASFAAANPIAAAIIGGGLAFGGHQLLMNSKKKAQKERRDIRTRASHERARETFAITEAYEGAARRAGAQMGARAGALGMTSSGPAFRGSVDARLPLLANIPGEVRAARDRITQREYQDLGEITDLGPALAGLLKRGIPALAQMRVG